MKIKIKKFEHSCLLIKADKKKFLLDPGEYSKEKLEKNKKDLENLDYILVTHEHPDHFSLPTVKNLLKENPEVKIIAPQKVIKSIGLKGNLRSGGDDNISVEFAKHEELLDMPIPENISYTILNKITHPGDSLQFKENADILALPVQAPWGSMTEAAKTALDRSPKVIIPIHDWHWKDEAKKALYQKLEEFFKNSNIKFINLYKKEEATINI